MWRASGMGGDWPNSGMRGCKRPGDHRQESGRNLAAGAVGDLATAAGGLGSCAATDRGLRCRFSSHDEAVAGRRNRPTAACGNSPEQAHTAAAEKGPILEERTKLRSERRIKAGNGCRSDAY